MKRRCPLLLVLLVLLSISAASNAPGQTAQPAARTEVYHVQFAKAAPGKAAGLGEWLRTPNPTAPMRGHQLVLRHQEGAEWDYAVIEHLGSKATVDAGGAPPPPAVRELFDWHTDTFVNGPAWPEFARAMGIADQMTVKVTGAVYVLSVYRAAPGHREPLEKFLGEPPAAGNTSAGNVLMQHLEGGAWQYLTIARYNSWQDFASNASNSLAQTLKGTGGWFQLREHAAFHNDTLTSRLAPAAQ